MICDGAGCFTRAAVVHRIGGFHVQKGRRQEEGCPQATDDEQGTEEEVIATRPHTAGKPCSLPMGLSVPCPEIELSLIAVVETVRRARPGNIPS